MITACMMVTILLFVLKIWKFTSVLDTRREKKRKYRHSEWWIALLEVVVHGSGKNKVDGGGTCEGCTDDPLKKVLRCVQGVTKWKLTAMGSRLAQVVIPNLRLAFVTMSKKRGKWTLTYGRPILEANRIKIDSERRQLKHSQIPMAVKIYQAKKIWVWFHETTNRDWPYPVARTPSWRNETR